MKRMYLFLALLLLLCVLLAACTPEGEESGKPTLPSPDNPSGAAPLTGPAGTEAAPPETDPGRTEAPPDTGPADTAEPAADRPDDSEPEETETVFVGIDIEDGYTEMIGEGIIVGGN